MEEARVISWYVARRVDASVDLAATTLDHLGEERALDVVTDAGALTLEPVPLAFTPFWGAPRRRLRGRLSPARQRLPVPVEVELTAWSQASAELGLRPTGRLPHGRRSVGYFDCALASMAELGNRLAARTPVRVRVEERLERAS
jgi:hypothetical protein